MARGRMVPRALFDVREDVGKRFYEVTTSLDGGIWAGMLYVAFWIHTDVEGRFRADAASVEEMLGRLGRSCQLDANRLSGYLGALARVGLIDLWGAGGDYYGEIVHFHDYNTVRRDREAPSTIPGNPANAGRVRGARGDSGSAPGGLPRGRSVSAAEGSSKGREENAGEAGQDGDLFGGGDPYAPFDGDAYQRELERIAREKSIVPDWRRALEGGRRGS